MYVVALKGVDTGDDSGLIIDNNDSSDSQSEESLLSLVTPELSLLSKYWLAALKDHALLSLPPGMLYLEGN